MRLAGTDNANKWTVLSVQSHDSVLTIVVYPPLTRYSMFSGTH